MLIYINRIRLTEEEASEFQTIIKKGFHTAKSFKVASILLNCDKATNEEIGKILKVVTVQSCGLRNVSWKQAWNDM
ncbi:MAG: hypothetical protein VB075_09370 [Petrimonas sp.]|uniref:hypothetical protein n=1 Tax=Petrimonas sp. TaxID=2023866 RepID=UPI002B38DFF4|nr:hypothetical protein [Petrimonas sp.]